MHLTAKVLLLILTAVLASTLTALLRRFALRRQMVDVPNQRSSHKIPTPRGGGAALVAVFNVFIITLTCLNELSERFAAAFLVGGSLIAIIGWLDDRSGLSAQSRFISHAVAAGILVILLGPLDYLPLPWGAWFWGGLGVLITFIAIIWCINLYNFMDGIDGIASVEAICLALGASLSLFAVGSDVMLPLFGLVAAVAGYLVWNWPPARIFMGDVGSGWLGYIISVFLLLTCRVGLNAWTWLILFAVFVVDATWTLLVRFHRGEKLFDAHCNHAYQKAARHFGAHRPVTLTVMMINLLWLWPLAVLATCKPHWGAVIAFVALLPLMCVQFFFRAGIPDFAPTANND